jgi:hypothetical protein
MITTIAAALINWNDLWKIMLASLIGGTGVAIVFALLLLGISHGKAATTPTARYGLYALSGLCGMLVVAVAAAGIYAMTRKSAAVKPEPKTAAGIFAPGTLSPGGRSASAPR